MITFNKIFKEDIQLISKDNVDYIFIRKNIF